MLYQSVTVDVPEIKDFRCPLRMVVLGEKDDVINPEENKVFFAKQEHNNLIQKVLTCSWLAHSIDFQTFDEMVFWSVRNYGVWKILSLI